MSKEDLGTITEVIKGEENRLYKIVRELGKGAFATAYEVIFNKND